MIDCIRGRRPNATLVITGDEDKPLAMPMGDLIMKRIRIVGSRQNTREDLYESLLMAAKSMGMTRQITFKQEHPSMAKETMRNHEGMAGITLRRRFTPYG